MSDRRLSVVSAANLIVLCNKIGMPWCYKPKDWSPSPHPWTGHALNLGHETNYPSDFAHEIGHWLVAEPQRRRSRYFGLDTRYSNPSDDQREEELASALGILIEKALGMDWRATLDHHNWYKFSAMRQTIRGLRRRGLVVRNTPACCL